MSNKIKYIIVAVILIIGGYYSFTYLDHANIQVLNPKGPIAYKEYHLIMLALLISLIVVIPVFVLTALFAFRYRETNKKAKYSPKLEGSKLVELVWWTIPTAIILVLSVITWRSSYQLDPYRPLSLTVRPVQIQVVSLDWKWLFIYPQQNIATINYIDIPVNTPVNFQLTSDTVMNSFWVPQLSGQIYSMPGMNTQLNLEATSTGIFNGSSANISGKGFAGMQFDVQASSMNDFNNWVNKVKRSPTSLTAGEYQNISAPSYNNPATYYSSVVSGLYDTIISKYNYLGGMQGMSMPVQTGGVNAQ